MRRAAAAATLGAICVAAAGTEAIDEVVVSGARIEQLRAEVVRLEDAFNARYNELNRERDFDIHCADEAATGTRFRRRVCRPVYADDAQAEQGRALAGVLNTGGSTPSAQLAILERNEAFRRNVEAVTKKDAELSRLVEARARAQARYEAAQRSAAGRKAGCPSP